METSIFNKGLEKEKELLGEMLAVSKEQLYLLQSHSGTKYDGLIEGFNRLLEKRQTLMDMIDQIEDDLKRAEPLPRDADKEIRSEINSLVKAIEKNDSGIQAAAQRTLGQIKMMLMESRNKRKAFKAYLPDNYYAQGCFIDRKR